MDSITFLQIPKSQLEEIHQHLTATLPNEGCGLLAGLGQQSVHVFKTPNKLNSPTRFEIEPKALWSAFQTLEKEQWRLLAIFHSHPDGPDRLSETDLRNHTYAEAVQILFFPSNNEWQHRAFLINKGIVKEIPIKIVTN